MNTRAALILGFAMFNAEAAQMSEPRLVTAPASRLIGETPASSSSAPALSGNGRYVAFVSAAPNLLSNAANGSYQVFLRELATSNLVLVSATRSDNGGNDHSLLPSLSFDATRVAFESEASDLVVRDTNGVSDIFVRDIATAQTFLVSGGNGPSRNPMMSSNGLVVFESHASDLVPIDHNGAQDIFLADILSPVLVTVNSAGTGSANGPSELLAITPDARFVAFWSKATDLTFDVVSGAGDTYVRDVQVGVTYCLTKGMTIYSNSRRVKVALTPDGQFAALQELSYSGPAPGGRIFLADVFAGTVSNIYCCGRPGTGLAISDDGNRFVFPGNDGLYFRELSSSSRRIVTNAVLGFETPLNIGSFQVSPDFQRLWFTMLVTNYGHQLFAYDLLTDQMTLVSTNASGGPIKGHVLSPFGLDDSGTLAAFETAADNYAGSDLNRASDVFLSTGKLVSNRDPALTPGTALGHARLLRDGVNANGRRMTFVSTDSSLSPNDTNQWYDAFLADLQIDTIQNMGSFSNSGVASLISADGGSVLNQRLGDAFQFMPLDLHHKDLRTGQTQLLGFSLEFPSFSQEGHRVVRRDTGGIFLNDFRAPGLVTTQRMDVAFNGGPPNGSSWNPIISLDGEWVAFVSRASNLRDPPVNDSVPHVYARNVRQQRTKLASFIGGVVPPGGTNPVFSASGRYIAFETYTGANIYRFDLLAEGTQLVCNGCARPALSGDGRTIVFQSQGAIYVTELQGTLELIAADQATDATISVDGRFVAFASRPAGVSQVYVHDRWNRTTHLLSQNHSGTGPGNGPSSHPAMSHDGRTIAFQSFASNLVPGDYNGRRDIFVVQISPVDTDADSIDDDWEAHYFQSLSRDGSGNADGDHLTDAQEYQAGSDPLDPESAIRLTNISASQNVEVRWTSAPGKTYRVQHKSNLASSWLDLPGEVIPGAPNGSATHLYERNTNGFYRIVLVE